MGAASALGRNVAEHVTTLNGAPPEPAVVDLELLSEHHPLPFHFLQSPESDLVDRAMDGLRVALTEALQGTTNRDMPIFIGTSSLDLSMRESRHAERTGTDGFSVGEPVSELGRFIISVCKEFDLTGHHTIVATACSAAANGMLYAQRGIADGMFDEALVIGFESYAKLSMTGFHGLKLLSTNGCRPFDAARDGLALGEACGVLRLSASKPGGGKIFRLLGGAQAIDTSSPTNSSPQAIARVVQLALDDANVAATDIDLIKAHGTGTPNNDLSEGQALHLAFKELPPIVAMKGWFGHTLGACGAIETAALLGCIEEGHAPATAGFRNPDSDIGMSPQRETGSFDRGLVLLNTFGFGGNNSSLVLEVA